MGDAIFTRFLRRSLEVLEAEAPRAYALVSERLGARAVSIQVGAECVGIQATKGRLVASRSLPSGTHARASLSTLRALLDGERGLTDAILAEEVVLIGELEDLVQFYEALLTYFRGAVRCPSFASLLDRFFAEAGGDPTAALAPRRMAQRRRTR